jgi:AraC-like DNA-binding protein
MNIVQERISHPHRSFRVLRLALNAFAGGRHRHRQIELTWVERGSGLRFVGDSVQAYEGSDMVLLGPRVPHAWLSAKAPRGLPHLATVVQFPPEVLDIEAWPELGAARALCAEAGRGLRIDGPGRSAVAAALQQVPDTQGLHGLAALLTLLACLVQHRPAMTPLASAPVSARAGAAGEQDTRIARVVDWVHRHLHQPLSNERAARQAHIAPASFSRYFRREVGKSFTEYVNDLRCSEAGLRLRSSDKPVALIAHECGYETLSHFNRQFKQRMGVTPREFRSGA